MGNAQMRHRCGGGCVSSLNRMSIAYIVEMDGRGIQQLRGSRWIQNTLRKITFDRIAIAAIWVIPTMHLYLKDSTRARYYVCIIIWSYQPVGCDRLTDRDNLLKGLWGVVITGRCSKVHQDEIISAQLIKLLPRINAWNCTCVFCYPYAHERTYISMQLPPLRSISTFTIFWWLLKTNYL